MGGTWPGQMHATQVQKHIAAPRRARPGIITDIRWCPAYKLAQGMTRPMSVPTSRRRSRTFTAEEPDAHGVERLQAGARPISLSRSLAHPEREFSEKKWVEVCRYAGWRPGHHQEIQVAA
jgi:hypothetical protein